LKFNIMQLDKYYCEYCDELHYYYGFFSIFQEWFFEL
jgi:hypothetical protein